MRSAFFSGILYGNVDAGLIVGGGNCLVSTDGLYYSSNGTSPTTDTYNPSGIGANTYVSSGQLLEFNRTAVGTTVTTADVYQQNGTFGWWGGWSEVYGTMFNNLNNSNQKPPTIQNVRHYTSGMTDVNTPTSVILRSPGASLISCLFFGDVQCTSGLGGSPISIGTQFYNGADLATVRSSLGIGTFKGTGITTQHSLINLGNLANNAQILLGGADSGVSLASLGTYEPQILSMGTAKGGAGVTEAIMQWRGAGSSDSTGMLIMDNAAYGSLILLINGYWSSSTQITPIHTTAPVFALVLGSPPYGLNVKVYDPGGSAAAFNYSAMTSGGGWKVGGSGSRAEILLMPPSLSANPSFSSGDYWESGIYYNTTTNKLVVNTGGTTWETITSA